MSNSNAHTLSFVPSTANVIEVIDGHGHYELCITTCQASILGFLLATGMADTTTKSYNTQDLLNDAGKAGIIAHVPNLSLKDTGARAWSNCINPLIHSIFEVTNMEEAEALNTAARAVGYGVGAYGSHGGTLEEFMEREGYDLSVAAELPDEDAEVECGRLLRARLH
jgi:hypothetical protein